MLTSEDRQRLRALCDAAKLPETPVYFEPGHNGQPYNLQCEHFHEGVRLHPIVLMKTLQGWEPAREVEEMIVGAINALPQLLDALEEAERKHEQAAALATRRILDLEAMLESKNAPPS